jgi:hypothetical protein
MRWSNAPPTKPKGRSRAGRLPCASVNVVDEAKKLLASQNKTAVLLCQMALSRC